MLGAWRTGTLFDSCLLPFMWQAGMPTSLVPISYFASFELSSHFGCLFFAFSHFDVVTVTLMATSRAETL